MMFQAELIKEIETREEMKRQKEKEEEERKKQIEELEVLREQKIEDFLQQVHWITFNLLIFSSWSYF